MPNDVAVIPHQEAPVVATAQEVARAWEPVQPDERIQLIDVLRGLALFGIIEANIRGFAGPVAAYMRPSLVWQTRADFWVQAFVDTFIQGKFITLFAVLFGAGFAIQFMRAELRHGRFGQTYRRRLEALILLGVLHQVLFWWGDILVTYGLGGFLLMLFRKRQPKTILRWALLLLLLPSAGMSGYMVFRAIKPQTPQQIEKAVKNRADSEKKEKADLEKAMQVYQTGSYVQIFRHRSTEIVRMSKMQVPAVIMTLPLFLFGAWVFRKGVFQDPERFRAQLRKALWLSLAIGIPANLASTWVLYRLQANMPVGGPNRLMLVNVTLVLIGRPILSVAYASAVGLLFLSDPWRKRMMPFAAIGRTALSNYLLQTIVCTTIFYGYGGRLFGRVHLLLLFLIAGVIYAAQGPLSRWWLSRYRFGPFEWLWRSMTYGKPPTMKLA